MRQTRSSSLGILCAEKEAPSPVAVSILVGKDRRTQINKQTRGVRGQEAQERQSRSGQGGRDSGCREAYLPHGIERSRRASLSIFEERPGEVKKRSCEIWEKVALGGGGCRSRDPEVRARLALGETAMISQLLLPDKTGEPLG